MLVSHPPSQVVDCIPFQPTVVREVDEIDSFRQAIFSFFVKSRK